MAWGRSIGALRCVFGLFAAMVALTAIDGSRPAPAHAAGGTVVCSQPYALCSYAPCLPLPGVPDKALCACDVLEGPNVGNKPCDERAQRAGRFGLTALFSAFSLAEIDTHPLMTCPEGSVWAQCLDAPCTVDPVDDTKAACTCDLQTSGVAQTYGGDCDTSTCANAFWSAATPAQVRGGIDALAKSQGIDPPQGRTCPSAGKANGGSAAPQVVPSSK